MLCPYCNEELREIRYHAYFDPPEVWHVAFACWANCDGHANDSEKVQSDHRLNLDGIQIRGSGMLMPSKVSGS
jgi:hypothetical protein